MEAQVKPLSTKYEGTLFGSRDGATVDGIDLNPRWDLRNHSPDGFSWGYGGSGPSQLALAILADFLEDDARATSLYMGFKWKVVAKLRQGCGWTLSGEEVRDVVVALEKERAG